MQAQLTPSKVPSGAPASAIVKACTWNVDYYNRKGAGVEDRLQLLRDLDADVVALQEVRGRYTRLYDLGPSVFSDEFFSGRNTSQWMISGLVFREGTIIDKGLIPLPDRPQRAVWALAETPGFARPVTYISWHSQHGVNVPAEYKMACFSAMSDWIAARPGPVVLGADINTWSDHVDLKSTDASDPYGVEHAFVGLDPAHGLRDAFRETLQRTGELSELRASGHEGPLAISHSETPTRRDRIMISRHFSPVASGYETVRGFSLSDHAPHWAHLRIDASSER